MTADDDFLERLRERDREAFAALHAEVGSALFGFAMTLVRDPDRAADLVQDAYVTALRNIDGFRGQSSVRTWLCGIVVNKAREQRRRTIREVPESSLPDEVADRFGGDGRWQDPPVGWDEPGARMDQDRLAAAAREEMEHLGEMARTVMEMCDLEGFTPVEAAEVLGLTNGNVRVILHRARATVRQRLERRLQAERAARGQAQAPASPEASGGGALCLALRVGLDRAPATCGAPPACRREAGDLVRRPWRWLAGALRSALSTATWPATLSLLPARVRSC
ncbi:MAG: hypothetical protein AMXMBFR64_01710 [Myxococcales bacterium]